MNDQIVYVQQVFAIPPRDLEGHGKTPKEIQDAGINTIQSFAGSGKILGTVARTTNNASNYSQYVGNVLRPSGGSQFVVKTVNDILWANEIYVSELLQTLVKGSSQSVNYVSKVSSYTQQNYVKKRK